jgi:hypothetical protein
MHVRADVRSCLFVVTMWVHALGMHVYVCVCNLSAYRQMLACGSVLMCGGGSPDLPRPAALDWWPCHVATISTGFLSENSEHRVDQRSLDGCWRSHNAVPPCQERLPACLACLASRLLPLSSCSHLSCLETNPSPTRLFRHRTPRISRGIAGKRTCPCKSHPAA